MKKQLLDEPEFQAYIIEQLGFPVDWQRLDTKNACRISITRPWAKQTQCSRTEREGRLR